MKIAIPKENSKKFLLIKLLLSIAFACDWNQLARSKSYQVAATNNSDSELITELAQNLVFHWPKSKPEQFHKKLLTTCDNNHSSPKT